MIDWEPVGCTPGSGLGSLFLSGARMLFSFFLEEMIRRCTPSSQCDSHAIPHSHEGMAFFLFLWHLLRINLDPRYRASLVAWHRTQMTFCHLDRTTISTYINIMTPIIVLLNK